LKGSAWTPAPEKETVKKKDTVQAIVIGVIPIDTEIVETILAVTKKANHDFSVQIYTFVILVLRPPIEMCLIKTFARRRYQHFYAI
jgi:hypothetical protein